LGGQFTCDPLFLILVNFFFCFLLPKSKRGFFCSALNSLAMAPLLLVSAFFGALLAFFGTGYFHGVHLDIEWKPAVFEGFDGVATTHKGHYKDVINVIKSTTALLVHDKIILQEESNVITSFGIFYDDPHIVKDSNFWHSRGGIVTGINRIAEIKANSVYQPIHIGEQKCITAEFPLVSQLSIFLGLFKVYPGLSTYEDKNKEGHGSVIELYDWANKKIRYIALEKSSPDSKF
jgi:hypothetical protein